MDLRFTKLLFLPGLNRDPKTNGRGLSLLRLNICYAISTNRTNSYIFGNRCIVLSSKNPQWTRKKRSIPTDSSFTSISSASIEECIACSASDNPFFSCCTLSNSRIKRYTANCKFEDDSLSFIKTICPVHLIWM